MKKMLLGFVTICVFLGLNGCSSKGSSKNYEISLEGNPTTGYTWEYEISEEGIVEMVNETSKVNSNLTGAPSTFVWEFKGVKEGTVTVTYSYARSFEDDSTIQCIVYTLVVDKNLNIEGTSEEIPVDDSKDEVGSLICIEGNEIVLSSNPTTGYTWKILFPEAGDDLVRIGEPEFEADSSVIGSGGTERFTIMGAKEGSVSLLFQYASLDDSDVVSEIPVSCMVDEDLTVICEQKE